MRLCGKVNGQLLPSQYPHYPASDENASDKHDKAVQAVAHLLARCIALGDAEYDGSKYREQQSRREMGQRQGHGFFPIAM